MFTLIMGSRSGGFGTVRLPSNCLKHKSSDLPLPVVPQYVSSSSPLPTHPFPPHQVFGVGMFCAISICCAASRTTWTFARDNAIPFSPFFSLVSSPSASAVPLNAHLLSTLVQLLLGLLYLGSSTAFNAFVGVSVMCLGASYAMPIAILLWGKREGVRNAPYGWRKSWFGWAVNVLALSWVCFEIVLFSMPAVVPVTKTTMSRCFLIRSLFILHSDHDSCQTMRRQFLLGLGL